jgi:hypothetical protein
MIRRVAETTDTKGGRAVRGCLLRHRAAEQRPLRDRGRRRRQLDPPSPVARADLRTWLGRTSGRNQADGHNRVAGPVLSRASGSTVPRSMRVFRREQQIRKGHRVSDAGCPWQRSFLLTTRSRGPRSPRARRLIRPHECALPKRADGFLPSALEDQLSFGTAFPVRWIPDDEVD